MVWYRMAGSIGRGAWCEWRDGARSGIREGSQGEMEKWLLGQGYPLLFLYYDELAEEDDLAEELAGAARLHLIEVPMAGCDRGPLAQT